MESNETTFFDESSWLNGTNSTDSVQSAILNVTRSYVQPSFADIQVVDLNWILNAAFIIFTMQTGFGFLESGCVAVKNEAHILMKNVADIALGGLMYWMVGYGLSFGKSPDHLDNSFVGLGSFFVDPAVDDVSMGPIFASFIFQLSFATTATTIVSGAMAERCNYKAYCLFCFVNVITYCVSAGWVWGDHGFLNKMGAVDIAGSGPVHLVGGSSAIAAAWMLGPRLGRYGEGREAPAPANPVNVAIGTFLLWWGWLAFNSGSTYGTSGAKWPFAARAAVTTMMGSFGGGTAALLFSMIKRRGKVDIVELMNGVLGSLVSITAGCFLYRTWEALIIGAIGSLIVCLAMPLFDLIKLDDPVGASSVHGCAGVWGVLAVGLFADNPLTLDTTRGYSGLFKGGGWHLLGVQALMVVCLSGWAFIVTTTILFLVDKIVAIRMDPYDELIGSDYTEHGIEHGQSGIAKALASLNPNQSYNGKSEETLTEYMSNASRETLNIGHDEGPSNLNAIRKRHTDGQNAQNGCSQPQKTSTPSHEDVSPSKGNDSLPHSKLKSVKINTTKDEKQVKPGESCSKNLDKAALEMLARLNEAKTIHSPEDYEEDFKKANYSFSK